jgi:ribonuclease HI
MKEVTLFTDGSCLGNPGPGGWACVLRYGRHERILRGVALRTTNNRMELEAAINGLLVLTERCTVKVITDSKYLQQGITVYLVGWQSGGWCNSRGEAIAIGTCGNGWHRWPAGTKRRGAGSAATDLIQIRTAAMFSRRSRRER